MRDRHDIWHPADEKNDDVQLLGSVYILPDKRLFFSRADYVKGDPIVYVKGMPTFEEFNRYFIGEFNVVFDHKTSRRLQKAYRITMNNHRRAIRDKYRGKEAMRRNVLKGKKPTLRAI